MADEKPLSALAQKANEQQARLKAEKERLQRSREEALAANNRTNTAWAEAQVDFRAVAAKINKDLSGTFAALKLDITAAPNNLGRAIFTLTRDGFTSKSPIIAFDCDRTGTVSVIEEDKPAAMGKDLFHVTEVGPDVYEKHIRTFLDRMLSK